jgi:hypothetical protein
MTNFENLTKSQLSVFEQICINDDAAHNQRTLDSLVRRGLIEEYDERQDVIFVIKRYRVPIPVHMAWCEWASEQEAIDF